MSNFVCLNESILKKSSDYINIETGRKIKKLNKKGFEYYSFDDYNICGTEENIEEFLTLNRLNRNILSSEKNDEEKTEDSDDDIPTLTGNSSVKKSTGFFSRIFGTKKEEENNVKVCRTDTQGSILNLPETTNVRDVPNELLESLCQFDLSGVRAEAKILNIVDGDTLDIAFYLRLDELTRERLKGRGKEKKKYVPMLTRHREHGGFIRYRTRINGIDVAEHDTAQGQFAILLLTEYFESLENIIYVQFNSFDKYGRALADIYSDSNFINQINEKLINMNVVELNQIIIEGIENEEIENVRRKSNGSYRQKNSEKDIRIYDPENQGILALNYDGGTKSELMGNFFKVPKGFITKSKHDNIIMKYLREL